VEKSNGNVSRMDVDRDTGSVTKRKRKLVTNTPVKELRR
jgi:hypothetical protein